MLSSDFEIIDISQPVNSRTTCFPGDVPFSKTLTVGFADSQVINLTAMTMSPHVGTHADAPSHIEGSIAIADTNIGAAELAPYVGRALVIDVSPMANGPITEQLIKSALLRAGHTEAGVNLPPRILLKSQAVIDFETWAGDYPYIGTDAVHYLHANGVQLVGIDTPSVDQVDSKELATHHALNGYGMRWLENLDLTRVQFGAYILVAAPLKLEEVEASPVRAILLR